MVYRMFFLGHNFAFGVLCRLKPKKLKNFPQNLAFSSPVYASMPMSTDGWTHNDFMLLSSLVQHDRQQLSNILTATTFQIIHATIVQIFHFVELVLTDLFVPVL